MSLDELFDQFRKEKLYLKGVSNKTLLWYDYSYRAFKKYCGELSEINKLLLKQFVMNMQQSTLSKRTVNNYIRGVNSFLTWLHENELIGEHFKIKKVKEEEKLVKTFT